MYGNYVGLGNQPAAAPFRFWAMHGSKMEKRPGIEIRKAKQPKTRGHCSKVDPAGYPIETPWDLETAEPYPHMQSELRPELNKGPHRKPLEHR